MMINPPDLECCGSMFYSFEETVQPDMLYIHCPIEGKMRWQFKTIPVSTQDIWDCPECGYQICVDTKYRAILEALVQHNTPPRVNKLAAQFLADHPDLDLGTLTKVSRCP